MAQGAGPWPRLSKPGELGARSHQHKSATGSHVWEWVPGGSNFWCSSAASSAPHFSVHLDLSPIRPASSFIPAPSSGLQDGHWQPQNSVFNSIHLRVFPISVNQSLQPEYHVFWPTQIWSRLSKCLADMDDSGHLSLWATLTSGCRRTSQFADSFVSIIHGGLIHPPSTPRHTTFAPLLPVPKMPHASSFSSQGHFFFLPMVLVDIYGLCLPAMHSNCSKCSWGPLTLRYVVYL